MWKLIFQIALFFCASALLGQDLEGRLVNWLADNSREQVLERLAEVENQYPDSPAPIFLSAFVETDARRANELYQQIVEKYPNSVYAESAMIKIGQFFFMTDSYQLAHQWFNDFLRRFPKSELVSKVQYLCAICSLAEKDRSKAEKEFKALLKQRPAEPYFALAQQELAALSGIPTDITSATKSDFEQNQSDYLPGDRSVATSEQYAVQVGAFSNQSNAIRLKEALFKEGYSVVIESKFIEGKKIYLVQIGSFANRNDARQLAEQINQRYAINCHVVNK
ncbi:MAG TPA: outer membrane protein assembly factor BamD [bacterium]|nr:outer membrane protein assembly factor BamD [bacterium]